MLRVSIITPVKAKLPVDIVWLEEAIESVIAQTSLRELEMIIVDDHSPIDLTPVKSRYDRITWLDAEYNGVSQARNQAVRAARSSLILPLDANDKLAPNAVERFLHAWDNGGSDQGIVYSDAILFSQDMQKHYIAPDYDFDKLLSATIMVVGSLHRKTDSIKIGGWREDLQPGLEDWEYWITMGETGICGFHIAEPLYWYRQHTSGRLAHIKTDRKRWAEAKARVRDLHREVYAGRYPMGCCGSGTVTGRNPKTPLPAMAVAADRVPIVYTGDRNGSFGFSGSVTRAAYVVPGRGMMVETTDGQVGVDPRDVQGVLAMRVFKQVQKPGSKPVSKPVLKPAPKPQPQPQKISKVAFDPNLGAVSTVALAPTTPSPILDPADYSITQLKALDLTTDTAYVMLSMEREGKNRKGAIDYLESLVNAG